MGPLVSLLKANHVREEFLRTNRDLLDTFAILARGEQLLVGGCCGWLAPARCAHTASTVSAEQRTVTVD